MRHSCAVALLSLLAVTGIDAGRSVGSYPYSPADYQDNYNDGGYGRQDNSQQASFTDQRTCFEKCEIPCNSLPLHSSGGQTTSVYVCSRLKPVTPVGGVVDKVFSSTFYTGLVVVAFIVLAILFIVCMCYCCNYCCRSPPGGDSSRGSSKQALAHNEDGEFKEFLPSNGHHSNGVSSSNGHAATAVSSNGNGHTVHHHDEGIGAMKREREFTRRPRGTPHIV